MNAIETSVAAPRRSPWWGRLTLVTAVALVWAVLRFGVDASVLARGLDRPVTVLVGDGGIVAGLVVFVVLLVGAYVGGLLRDRREDTQGLLVIGFALGLWAFHGGTMDDWLKLKNPVAGPPSGVAYWPLLAEYVYWAVVLAGVVALRGWRPRASESGRAHSGWQRVLGADLTTPGLRDGITALVVTVAVAATLMLILSGPRLGHTYRGQVYFAVAVGFVLAVLVARRVSGVRSAIWYLPAPLVIGAIGVLRAGWKPALGAGYENINVIPPWALARPLPIEMVSVGLVGILLTLRTATRLSPQEDRG